MDDSGYFSVQVLSAALSVWGLELLPYSSSDLRAVAARTAPKYVGHIQINHCLIRINEESFIGACIVHPLEMRNANEKLRNVQYLDY